ncbi:phage major capsid protein [Dyadobacter sp. Leaf189]|uniref:phage major capsid protein n=1 Tax=Dyadobacter sp. Leaf189 TaxID=1736295 RepID=UPI0006FCCCEF|nr:phage major capsid protein [Dyadobacter sp. Leaf189]KQS33965.1 hypothetical protein ASG33_08010 [Dyadobacter sp. Leaf189]
MGKLKDLRDKRAVKFEEMQTASKVGEAEKRDLTDDEFNAFKALKQEVVDLDAQIARQEELENLPLARAVDAGKVAGSGADNATYSEGDKKDLRGFNLMRAIQRKAQKQTIDGIEGEVLKLGEANARLNAIEPSEEAFYVPAEFMQKRGQTVTLQTTSPGDQGGILVPTEIMPLLDMLWSQTWLKESGARFLTGLTGNPRFPVQTTKPTVQELTEIEEMGYTEILFSDFGMTPKRRGVTIPISKQSILQSSIDIQELVMENISMALAQYMNVEAIGILLGAITAPNGNLLALGTNGAKPTYENLVDLEALIETKDALRNTPKYLTNAKMKAVFKKTQVFTGTSGEPVWGKGNILNDYPTIVSNLVPSNLTKGSATAIASAIIFGNFNDLYVGLWGGVEFIVDPFSAKKKAQTEITANTFYDIKVARTQSFAGIKDALVA